MSPSAGDRKPPAGEIPGSRSVPARTTPSPAEPDASGPLSAAPEDEPQEDPRLSFDEDGPAAAPASVAAAHGRGDAASILFDFRVELATVFGVGHVPFASGTFGSAVALPIAYFFAPAASAVYLGLCALLARRPIGSA